MRPLQFLKRYLPLHSLKNARHLALIDSLAQLVEHNTFNVGVMGSSPMRVTKRGTDNVSLFLLIIMESQIKWIWAG